MTPEQKDNRAVDEVREKEGASICNTWWNIAKPWLLFSRARRSYCLALGKEVTSKTHVLEDNLAVVVRIDFRRQARV